MAVKPVLSRRGRIWLISPLGNLNRGLGRLRGWLLLLLGMGLLWLLQQHASLTQVAAGIAIFLFGMFFLEQGFSQLASLRWRRGLRSWTATLPHAFGLGLLSTVLTQSSALVGLLTLSFLSARMIDFVASIGILAGASLGTTSGGWLIAAWGLKINIGHYALPLLVLGMLLISMPRWGTRGLGQIISGTGFLFLGIDYIRLGFTSLSDLIQLQQLAVSGWQGIVLYALLGALVTLVLQSSHAALLLLMAALSAGQLSYDNALALLLGVNVGATGPVLMGALNSSVEGQRLAFLDLGFKSITALLCLGLFYPFRWGADLLADLLAIPEAYLTLRIALCHTLYNLLAISWILPLRYVLATQLPLWWPDNGKLKQASQARYLDRVVAAHPATAEQALLREVMHLLHQCQDVTARGMLGLSRQTMLRHTNPHTMGLGEDLPSMAELYQQRVKPLFGEIIRFAALCKASMSAEQVARIDELVSIARSLTEAVRLERQLQTNLVTMLTSEDELLLTRYRGLQRRILLFQQALQDLAQVCGNSLQIDSRLNEMTVRIEMESRHDREDIEWLIRSDKLDAMTAATLMNDIQTLRRLQKQQIKAIRQLFVEICQQREWTLQQFLTWLAKEEQMTPS